MIKIAHEAPIDIFEEVQGYTDYDYALVHLLEQNPRYRDAFERAIKKGREIILDNSIFELEEAFDADRFAYWINELRPTWYIVPDALEDTKKTVSQMAEWNMKYADKVYGKKIGVVQGKTYKQIVGCYEYMDKLADVDMIAISFDYSYYTESVPHPNKYVSWMLGRVKLLGDLLRDGVINENKPHHLLGCGLPQEFSFYKHSDYNWIYSLDTSNPVVHGIKGIKYGSDGLWSKESQKLHELIEEELELEQEQKILHNIERFRWLTNG
jgi:nitrate reductase NapAB chaperone NapD